MTRPTYVYRVIVDRWPDWCPNGWDRIYSDEEREDGSESPPDELRELAESGALPDDLPHERVYRNVYPDNAVPSEWWAVIACPRRNRVNWLSAAAAHRWVRHAIALGAEAHLERGTVGEWVRQ